MRREEHTVNEYATAPVEAPADIDQEFETIHRYPGDSRYRRSGSTEPQPGDIAFCGWVKQQPNDPSIRFGDANCLMCLRLDGLTR
jgi:hypothetical protein